MVGSFKFKMKKYLGAENRDCKNIRIEALPFLFKSWTDKYSEVVMILESCKELLRISR